MFPCARGGRLPVLLEPSGFALFSRSNAVLKSKISAVCLLTLCLVGCMESADDKKPSERTGAVGVTSQDIDDLAKPATPPKNANGK